MIRRLVQLTGLSLLATFVLIASVPEKRTATIRLEIWVLAVLAAALLLHLTRDRLPLTPDPVARSPKPEALPNEPLAVETLVTALTLAPSPQERIRRSAQIELRDALRSAGALLEAERELPTTIEGWSALIDDLEAS